MSEVKECAMALATQAELDGELTPDRAAELRRHRADCPLCRQQAEEFARVRSEMQREGLYHAAPARLRAFAAAQAATAPPARARPAPRPGRWRWAMPALSFSTGALAAAAIAVFLLLPQPQSVLVDRLVDEHVRALQAGHLMDVPSTDRHTVKPWFDGRLDFAPPVKDLAERQFPLQGGRLDYLNGRAVAGLVYEHSKHIINVFVWPESGGDAEPTAVTRNGYNLVRWRQDNMAVWAVSDLERDQLVAFAKLWREAG